MDLSPTIQDPIEHSRSTAYLSEPAEYDLHPDYTRILVLGTAPAMEPHCPEPEVAGSPAEALAWLAAALTGGDPDTRQYGVAVVEGDLSLAAKLAQGDPGLEILLHGVSASPAEADAASLSPERCLCLCTAQTPENLAGMVRVLATRRAQRLRLAAANVALQQQVEDRARALMEANRRLKADMEVRMQMLQELLESEERYRSLFEEDITGDFVAGPDGRLKACNMAFARIFGFVSVEAALGVNIFDLELETQDKESLAELLSTRERLDKLEAAFHREGRHTVYVFGNVLVARNPQGEVTEIRGYLLDITDRKRLEEQLRIAQKMEAIGTLAGGIAHDFNNILGVITGYAEIVLENSEKGTRTHRRVREILNACRRAKELVNQVLNFSRQGALERKALRVTPLIRETVKMLSDSLPEGVVVRQSILASNDTVMADASQVHQVLLNLCTNAAQAMAQSGGLVEIGLNEAHLDDVAAAMVPGLEPGTYVVLSVSDQGPGIADTIQEKIFDPFFTTKKPGEGTGMGLAVVHGIAQRHGGAVMLHSEPGHGATFQVFLPSADMLSGAEPDEEDCLPMGSGNILFVDDEKALLDIGREMLTSLGYQVVARTSSVEALEAFRHDPDRFDAVIADQTMPNMSGLDMAAQLLDVRPDVPVLLCTGFSEVISYGKAQDMGVKTVLMKPMLKRQLAEALYDVLK